MVDMKIVFLGTSAAIPTEKRCLSSIVIKRGGELLIFDAGEGMQKNFLQAKLGLNKKMKIFITHMHIDHCLGLIGFFQTMSLLGRTKKLIFMVSPDWESSSTKIFELSILDWRLK